jgi:uncharacterized protein with GYD domain
MVRYLVLVDFTDKGVTHVTDSIDRAKAFATAAEQAGAKVETQYWTVGAHDGAFVLSAPDDLTASSLVLALGRSDNIRTTMLRAYDAGEFAKVVGGIPNLG